MHRENNRVLVTGGAGFIGSHTCVVLLDAGYEVIIIDNFSNSSQHTIEQIQKITNKTLTYYHNDICDQAALDHIFTVHKPYAVIHFAGLKSIQESIADPLSYYINNVAGSICLFNSMEKFHTKHIIFSSSATVYGNPTHLPLQESSPVHPNNPYAKSKLNIEHILHDTKNISSVILRYFNPVGNHPSGLIGENPKGIPNNLMPYLSLVAAKKLDTLYIYGNDYQTPDGTGVRDYIHVMDLAEAHLAALTMLPKIMTHSATINIGTGHGYSVFDMLRMYEKVVGHTIPHVIADRRPGDIDSCWADVSYAKEILNWQATRDLYTMCLDSWHWQLNSASETPTL